MTDHPDGTGSPTGFGGFGSSLRDLPRLRSGRRRRESSWDRTGGNIDRIVLEPGSTTTICDIDGAGCINHIWMTAGSVRTQDVNLELSQLLRRLVLAVYWDSSEEPSVLVPLGDFFGVGHGMTVNYASLPLQMSPQDGKSLNCFFHMPFASRARFEIRSEMEVEDLVFYYYIDYEAYDFLEDGLGRFHASWNRENPTEGKEQGAESNMDFLLFQGTNLDGADNYVILDAEGRGHYVGCVLNVDTLRDTAEYDWFGEGDDMIFIDGEPFPPSLHGTGTEDYFNTAWSPTQTYSSPYHGITLGGGPNWKGPVSYYRFHIEDPVMFSESIRVTIEHGHANKRADDLSSTAYWYQTLPHRKLELAAVEERLPRRFSGVVDSRPSPRASS